MDIPHSFPFPFEPYPIQLDFMKNLYQCIEEGKLGIFESPTGTGKSLSLICGALTWLENHEKQKKSLLEEELNALNEKALACEGTSGCPTNEPSWFTFAKQNVSNDQRKSKIKEELNKIYQQQEKIQNLKTGMKAFNFKHASLVHQEARHGVSHSNLASHDIDLAWEDMLIEECVSDEDSVIEEPVEEIMGSTKIIYASRTHSQISQFVKEVKRSPFGNNIRLCSLASRQQMCINEAVVNLKSMSAVNDRCLEMQKMSYNSTLKSNEGKVLKKSKGSNACPFLDTRRVQLIRDASLVEIMDVENFLNLGKIHKACPYYASRHAIKDSQLIVVPYATLLQPATREACGLHLRNNVVIIDEAHNLLEAIASLNNITVWGHHLSYACWQLGQYQERFQKRLSAKNLLPIKQLQFFLSCLLKSLGLQEKTDANQLSINKTSLDNEKLYECSKFFVEAGFDNINVHKLVEFCEKSKLPQKLLHFKPPSSEVTPAVGLKSFLNKRVPPTITNSESTTDPVPVHEDNQLGSSLMIILEFMRCLCNPSQDGRILCIRKVRPSSSCLKYVLLNPGSLFKDFVNQPRSVVVAGGTMQPISEFEYQLFGAAGADQNRIAAYSFGHVIPPNHVLPLVLSRGPSSKELNFNWTNRKLLLNELANLLLNINQVVSGGIVCFLPSYEFESEVVDHFRKHNFISKFESRKSVFREPKEASQVEHVLSEYTRSILQCSSERTDGKNGAMMLCVVGGKLSEGINFSDDLARCVVVVGLPYPNSQSVELKEKMNYLNNNMANLRPQGESRSPGQIYYESLCFKAVNQSIGRAIRHSRDYAVLVLADSRYARATSLSLLPEWITREIRVTDKFGPSLATIRKV